VTAARSPTDRDRTGSTVLDTSGSAVFDRVVLPLRGELHRHCYRMLASVSDAEDAVQETLLRAWRHRDELDPGRPVRAWVYQVATNVCLSMLAARRRRPVGLGLDLDPYPDSMLDPEGLAERREAIELSFVAAIQALPARQRAVLVLRDVCGLPAAEVAAALQTGVTAVNSALQRARAGYRREREQNRLARPHTPAAAQRERALAAELAAAWEAGDIATITGLLAADAMLAMPPVPLTVIGPSEIARFLREVVGVGVADRFRATPAAYHRQPAVALTRSDEHGRHEPYAVLVLSLDADTGLIASITRFAGSPPRVRNTTPTDEFAGPRG
jgi:RNA polymerase sigma factor (sigma-70 family)